MISSYDYDTRMIHGIDTQIELIGDKDTGMNNSIPIFRFWELMQKNRDAIATWNVNNGTIALLTNNFLYLRNLDGSGHMGNEELPVWKLPNPIQPVFGVHIGYVRTIDKTKLVYHYPWYLFYNPATRQFLDERFAGETLIGEPKVNPPMSLYKELLDTDCNAVYVDSLTNKPIFMKGDF